MVAEAYPGHTLLSDFCRTRCSAGPNKVRDLLGAKNLKFCQTKSPVMFTTLLDAQGNRFNSLTILVTGFCELDAPDRAELYFLRRQKMNLLFQDQELAQKYHHPRISNQKAWR